MAALINPQSCVTLILLEYTAFLTDWSCYVPLHLCSPHAKPRNPFFFFFSSDCYTGGFVFKGKCIRIYLSLPLRAGWSGRLKVLVGNGRIMMSAALVSAEQCAWICLALMPLWFNKHHLLHIILFQLSMGIIWRRLDLLLLAQCGCLLQMDILLCAVFCVKQHTASSCIFDISKAIFECIKWTQNKWFGCVFHW